MLRRVFGIFFLSIVLKFSIFAQNFSWAAQFFSSIDDWPTSITCDSTGNVYVAGIFNGTKDFDPGPGTYTLQSNSFTTYFAKLNTLGQLVWVRSFVDPLGWINQPNCIKTDINNNVYVCGYFTGTIDVDPGPGIVNLSSATIMHDAYLCKFNSDGALLWAKSFGGTDLDVARSLDVKDSNSIYLTGNYNGLVDFDPGSGTFTLSSNQSFDVYISKFDHAGNFAWAKSVGGANNDEGISICTNTTGIYVVGSFLAGANDFDPGPGTFTLNNAGSYDLFVLKLDHAGIFQWAKRIGGLNNDEGRSILTTTNGDICLTGYFSGTVDFDPGPGLFNVSSVFGTEDAFFLKLSSNGNLIWAKTIGGPGNDRGNSIASNLNNELFLTGTFQNAVDFDPGPGLYNLSSAGNNDLFNLKLDVSGNLIWASKVGGSNNDQGLSNCIDVYNSLYSTGSFQSTNCDFDPGVGTSFMSATNNNRETYILKLVENCPIPANPSIQPIPSGTVLCSNQSLTLSTSNSAYILWYQNTYTTSIGTGTSFVTNTLSVGIYTFYSQAITCSANPQLGSITLSVIPEPLLFLSGPSSICLGGNAAYQVNGAQTYTWNNSSNGNSLTISPASSTIITVSGTGTNGCINTSSMNLLVSPLPSLSIIATPSIHCLYNSSTLFVTGGNTYTWNTGSNSSFILINPTSNTIYSVTGANSNNCVNTTTVNITVNSLPTFTLSPANATICIGESLIISANGATSYSWSTGSTNNQITFSPSQSSYITITAFNSLGCSTKDSANIFVDECINLIEKTSDINQLLVYPNPAHNQLTISYSNNNKPVTAYFYSANGSLVKTISYFESNKIIDISELGTGLFLLKVVINNIDSNYYIINSN